MSFGGPVFVIAIVAICMAGWVVTTWIRAKHGYPLEDQFFGTVHKDGEPANNRQIELLSNENAQLKGQLGRLEERLAVLERIATDPATRTAREIDSLR